MDPKLWDAYAAKFGQSMAAQKLGPRPEAAAGPSDEKRPGVIAGTVRAAAQGATFGLSDELAGLATGAGAMLPGGRSPGEAYRGARDESREKSDQFREDHPILSLAGEFAGGAATGGVTGSAARRMLPKAGAAAANGLRGLLARTAINTAEGAATGAVAGAGTAESGERLQGAVRGMAWGGGFGAGVSGAGEALKPVAGRVLDAVGARPKNAETLVGRAVGNVVENAEDRASRKTLQALDRDNLSTLQIRQRADMAGDKPVTIPDLAPEEGSTSGLLRAVKSIPGHAKAGVAEALTERSHGELGRIGSDIARRTGLPQEFAEDTAQGIIQRRAATYGPEYDRVLDAAGIVTNPQLTRLLDSNRSSIQRGVAAARQIAREQGRDAFIEGQPLAAVTARDLHYLKLGVDDVLRGMAQTGESGGAKGTLYKNMNETRESLLGLMDEAVSGYGDVRANWSDESSMLDAVRLGGEMFDQGTDHRSVRQTLAKMTPDERNMYRRGAIDALQHRLGDVTDDASQSNRVMRTPNLREKVRLLVDDPAEADALLADLGLERRMGQTKNKALAGSRTAELQAEQADLMEVPRFQIPTSAGGALRALLEPAGNAIAQRAQGFSGKVSEGLGNRLTAGTKGREDLLATMRLLEEYAAREAKRKASGSAVVRGGAASVGLAAGRSKP